MSELKQIYLQIRNKKYREMEDWEKFLCNDNRKNNRRKKKQRENEVLVDSTFYEFHQVR